MIITDVYIRIFKTHRMSINITTNRRYVGGAIYPEIDTTKNSVEEASISSIGKKMSNREEVSIFFNKLYEGLVKDRHSTKCNKKVKFRISFEKD